MMNNRRKAAMAQYKSVNIDTGVSSADPNQLVLMLMDGAIQRMAQAKTLMKQGNIKKKIEVMTRSVEIVDSLRSSLNFEQGGPLVENLEALYDYITRELVMANSRNDTDKLDELSALLNEVRGAWKQVADMESKKTAKPVKSMSMATSQLQSSAAPTVAYAA
ncbi:MAG: flagellar export chaperone FliS [Thiotrichales bacterium]|jgi:flagellar protein FliS|nr:flagellar export chaperone FliS [Thiotrichales bacterium]